MIHVPVSFHDRSDTVGNKPHPNGNNDDDDVPPFALSFHTNTTQGRYTPLPWSDTTTQNYAVHTDRSVRNGSKEEECLISPASVIFSPPTNQQKDHYVNKSGDMDLSFMPSLLTASSTTTATTTTNIMNSMLMEPSIFLSDSSIMKSFSLSPRQQVQSVSNSNPTVLNQSMGFTQLLEQAEDTSKSFHTYLSSSTTAKTTETIPSCESKSISVDELEVSPIKKTSIPSFSVVPTFDDPQLADIHANPMIPAKYNQRTESMHRSSHSRQYIFCNDPDSTFHVSSRISSEDSFQVTTTFIHTSMNCVLNILSDPNLLQCWLEPIQGIVVMEERGGAMAQNVDVGRKYTACTIVSKEEQDGKGARADDRELHDGYWIEAATSRLMDPSTHCNCLHSCVNLLKTMVGFPSCGNIQIFIERNRGHVGFTLGKFHGGLVLSHNMTIRELEGGNVCLLDDVRVYQEGEETFKQSTTNTFCNSLDLFGLRYTLRRWYSPSLKDFLRQTVASMRNLGRLVSCEGVDFYTDAVQTPNRCYTEKGEDSAILPLLECVY